MAALETESHAHNIDLNLFNFDVIDEEEHEEVSYPVLEELKVIDVNAITPIEALNILVKLKSML